jgi:quinol monooxygenase YgiN
VVENYRNVAPRSASWPDRQSRGRHALAAVTVSAKGQSAENGLKTGYIALQYTGEVLPDQMDKFKQVAAKVIAAVAQEPGTLMYEWTLRPDQKTFDVIELYKNSDAVVAHVKHVIGDFGNELGEVQKGTALVVHGSPNYELRKAAAALNPVLV